MLDVPQFDHSCDLSQLRCPHLVITVIRELRQLPEDSILHVIATDLNAPSSLTAWCAQSGNELLLMYEENGRFVFFIRNQMENATPFIQ